MNRKGMAEIKCPVCGKVGIPDYHVQDTICPQCGSDLSIYKLAHDIETVSTQIDGKKVSRKVWVIPAAIACCLAVILVCVSISGSNAEKNLELSEKENSALQAQIRELQQTQEHGQAVALYPNTDEEAHFVYTVRPGDSFWLISKRLYGTGTRYSEIVEANGLAPESKLSIGDKLIIK